MKSLSNTLIKLESRLRKWVKDAPAAQDLGRNLSTILVLTLAALSLTTGANAQNGTLTTEMDSNQSQFAVYYIPFYSPNFYEQNLYKRVNTGTPTQVTGIGGTPSVGGTSPFGVAAYYNTIGTKSSICSLRQAECTWNSFTVPMGQVI